MRFSERFNITASKTDDWFDLECTEDTPLYIDPFLVFDDSDPLWEKSHQDVTSFFELALGYVAKSNGNPGSVHWRKAERMLTFPEPKEFALGLAMGSPDGAGTGSELATKMVEALDIVRRHSISSIDYVETFTLFCDGMGVDRISDAFCNIMKATFVAYTQNIARRHNIPLRDISVKHVSWHRGNGRWNDLHVKLPESPVHSGGLILTPRRFLKDIPRVTADGFWSWATANESQTLRDDLNYDLGSSLSKSEKIERAREVARAKPEIALRYIETRKQVDVKPYDVENDPSLLVGWAEAGRSAAVTSGLVLTEPSTPEDFFKWLKNLAEEFRDQVENTDLWKVFWDDGFTKHRQEKIIQAVAGAMWVSQCKAANIDISKEPNMGRGPVDFKFSKGWDLRALLEVKLMNSTKFAHGAETQLPQYLKTERVKCGVYLAVGFTDKDFDIDRQNKVTATCKAIGKAKGIKVEAVLVDARHNNKASASKLKKEED